MIVNKIANNNVEKHRKVILKYKSDAFLFFFIFS